MEAQRAQRAVLLNIALNEIIMKNVLNIDASSSESESEMEILYMMQFSRLRGKRKKGVRIEGYVNDVVSRFTTHQFKEHFRMTPNCFQLLENKFGLMLSKRRTGRPFISPRVQLLATIWLLGTPDSYRSVGLKFNLAKSSLSHCVRRVVLINSL